MDLTKATTDRLKEELNRRKESLVWSKWNTIPKKVIPYKVLKDFSEISKDEHIGMYWVDTGDEGAYYLLVTSVGDSYRIEEHAETVIKHDYLTSAVNGWGAEEENGVVSYGGDPMIYSIQESSVNYYELTIIRI